MLSYLAFALSGGALMASSANVSRATFELRGYVPVQCNASVLQQEYSANALTLFVGERCNTSYTLQLRLPSDSKATRVVFAGREIPVRDGTIAITRSAFSGSLSGGEPLRIQFSESGAAERLRMVSLDAVATSPF